MSRVAVVEPITNADIFEIKISIEGKIDSNLQLDITTLMVRAISNYNTTLKIKNVSISNVNPNPVMIDGYLQPKTQQAIIDSLSGRSKVIVRFLYDNPGIHTTADISKVATQYQPFKNGSIIHSYLNNLTGRGIIEKVATGLYRIV